MSIDLKNRDATLGLIAHVVKLIDYAQSAARPNGARSAGGVRSRTPSACTVQSRAGSRAVESGGAAENRLRSAWPESAVIGERAKHYGCYVAFGCYARDKDWPNHVINMSVIVGPDGNIVKQQWKARNILGAFGGIGLIGTTVYDVLDRYVEMYGWDATLPVARTDIGNIAMTAVGMEPMLYQALAMKGAEILILTVTGASNSEQAIQTARMTRTWCVGVGNSVSPDNPGVRRSVRATRAPPSSIRGTALAESRQTAMKTS
ncbi:MAG: hypothetical protein U1F31_02375 [Steroidobacteraceae bacterium]